MTPPAPRVGLALVLYRNDRDEVDRVLEAWGRQTRPPERTYVVANSSLSYLPALSTRATVLEPGSNLGFTGGANLAAAAAAADGCSHLLLSNVDVTLLSEEIVAKLLVVFADHEDCAFASPGIVMWPESSVVWYRGGRLHRPLWVTRHPGIGRPWRGPSLGAVRTGYFSGCCVLVDLAPFSALGGFDTSLFMYYDEVELASRARGSDWHSWLLDEPLVAHAKTDRRLGELEAYRHARNARVLLERNETGVRRIAGAIGQLLVLPLQVRRCRSWAARRAYVAGALGAPPAEEG